jgi:hypothetical protein
MGGLASQSLNGRRVAILLAPAGTEQVEFTETADEPGRKIADGKKTATVRRGVIVS